MVALSMKSVGIAGALILGSALAWFAWGAISAPASDGRATPKQIEMLEASLAGIEPAVARGARAVVGETSWAEAGGPCVEALTDQAYRLANRPPVAGGLALPTNDTCAANAHASLLGTGVYAGAAERAALSQSVRGLRVFDAPTSIWFTPDVIAACAAHIEPTRLNLQLSTGGRHELFCG